MKEGKGIYDKICYDADCDGKQDKMCWKYLKLQESPHKGTKIKFIEMN